MPVDMHVSATVELGCSHLAGLCELIEQTHGEKPISRICLLACAKETGSVSTSLQTHQWYYVYIAGIWIDRLKTHEKTPVRNVLLRTISDIFLALYFLTDHPLYFQRIGFVKLDKSWVDFIDYWNNIFWLVECIIDIYCDLCDLYHIDKEIKNLVQQQKLAAIAGSDSKLSTVGGIDVKLKIRELQQNEIGAKKLLLILSIVRGSADVPVIFHFMGNPNISSGMGGFFGTISSSVSLYTLWGK